MLSFLAGGAAPALAFQPPGAVTCTATPGGAGPSFPHPYSVQIPQIQGHSSALGFPLQHAWDSLSSFAMFFNTGIELYLCQPTKKRLPQVQAQAQLSFNQSNPYHSFLNKMDPSNFNPSATNFNAPTTNFNPPAHRAAPLSSLGNFSMTIPVLEQLLKVEERAKELREAAFLRMRVSVNERPASMEKAETESSTLVPSQTNQIESNVVKQQMSLLSCPFCYFLFISCNCHASFPPSLYGLFCVARGFHNHPPPPAIVE